MESDVIRLNGYLIKYFSLNTLIAGSGAASLNAAITLHSMGQEDIMIATSGWVAGTSRNAGSDKQTYYKLSLCGDKHDSALEMAKDLFNGRCMHGDIALCEAQGSVRSFMKLVEMGVAFPHDKYGGWVGYKTDHDPAARATSAGPYTSRMMVGVLSSEVRRLRIRVLDNHHLVALLTDREKSKVVGAIAINTSEKEPDKAFVLFNATNIILGTGGPGDIYSSSVYPESQTGSTGMAFKAGATGQNLTESQFGIASTKFRWNLSGSYQQVIPRYFSIDSHGRNEKEFLNDHFPDYSTLTKAIFLKGYQWPFDVSKVADYGSSLIDILVFREKHEKNRRIFMDFTRNVSWNSEERFSEDELAPEVKNYLERSGALQSKPVDRLRTMNNPSFELYRDNGIDLSCEPVEIAVCAQHNNGGLKGNIWWESDLKHLFPVGEVNGSHGVFRPGGSALNSGQTGSFRAAQYIFKRYSEDPLPMKDFLDMTIYETERELDFATGCLLSGGKASNKKILNEIRNRMSENAGIIRNHKKVVRASEEAYTLLLSIKDKIGASTVRELKDCFQLMDNCLTHFVYLEAIRIYMENGGRSRGSSVITDMEISDLPDMCQSDWQNLLCNYDRKIEKNVLETRYNNYKVLYDIVKVRDIPDQDLWFEKVWKDYLEDKLF